MCKGIVAFSLLQKRHTHTHIKVVNFRCIVEIQGFPLSWELGAHLHKNIVFILISEQEANDRINLIFHFKARLYTVAMSARWKLVQTTA